QAPVILNHHYRAVFQRDLKEVLQREKAFERRGVLVQCGIGIGDWRRITFIYLNRIERSLKGLRCNHSMTNQAGRSVQLTARGRQFKQTTVAFPPNRYSLSNESR